MTKFKIFMRKDILLKLVLITVYILFLLQLIFPVSSLLFLNKFSQHESYVITGIKYSNDYGITSYGMFPVGYIYEDQELNGYSVENNIYKATDILNNQYYSSNYLPDNVSRVTYSKSGGLTARLIPYLISKTNIFQLDMHLYISFVHFSISFLSFSLIVLRLFQKYNFLTPIIFICLNLMNSFFITIISSITTSYAYLSLPLAAMTFQKIRNKILYKNDFLITYLIYFICLSSSRTQGFIPFFVFLSGIILFDKKDIKLKNHKIFMINNFLIFMISYISVELFTVLQRLIFLKISLKDSLDVFLSSLGKYDIYNTQEVIVNSCSQGGYKTYIFEFINTKLIDLIFYELDVVHILIFILTIRLFNISLKSKKMFNFTLMMLGIVFVWFFLIKGAFLCHLHVYPRYLLYTFLPVLSVFIGNIKSKSNK